MKMFLQDDDWGRNCHRDLAGFAGTNEGEWI
jgi:hypothetical protein